MKCSHFMSLVVTILTFSSAAFSSTDVLRIGQATYSGTGCEQGSATLSLSPDRSQLSVLFNNFLAESGSRLGKQVDRKGCILNLPIHVPAGFALNIATVDYRGFMSLPKKTRGQFIASSFFAGAEKFREDRQFKGPFMDNFIFRSQATGNEKTWSQCGSRTMLRTQAVVIVNSGQSGEDTMGGVDSVDVSAGISYRFELRPCQGNNPPAPLPPPGPVDPYPNIGGMSAETGLVRGQGIRSPSGKYLFIHQDDGNVVVYGPQGSAMWTSNTQGQSTARLVMQGDGNLVIYNVSGDPIWDSKTYGHPGSRLAIQDDGNVVIYDVSNNPIWWTHHPFPNIGTMAPNTELLRGQGIRSPQGHYSLVHQDDGNVVMYGPQGAVWSTNTQGQPSERFVMQSDGNLVIYNSSGQSIWDSQTYDQPGSRLLIQDDGNLVIYNSNNIPIWSIF